MFDNNFAEQAIRPFTIVRKNSVLIESTNVARASAMIYSLVETAKTNLQIYISTPNYCLWKSKHMNNTNPSCINELLPWSPTVQEKRPNIQ